jgi:opacity protein-like surface antigen
MSIKQKGALTMKRSRVAKRSHAAKRSWVAGAVLTSVLAGSALAADMPLKAPPVPRVVSDWTGFYIGIHGGYGWARPSISDFDLNRSNPLVSLFEEDLFLHAPRPRGPVFGGHAGYNWQWGQRGVVGLEIDYSVADIRSTQEAIADLTECCAEIDKRTLTSKLDSLASARARIGFLVAPEFLLYGTGGAAWGHMKFTDTLALQFEGAEQVYASRASANHFGWVAGAGTEWKLWDTGLMLRVEYLHYDFGSTSLAFDTTINPPSGAPVKGSNFNLPVGRLTTDVVRGGVSYKF